MVGKCDVWIIYIIIRHCSGVGAFPRPFCVPNSVALASLTLQVYRGLGHSLVPIPITARVIRRFQKNICRSTRTDLASFSLSDRRAAPHSRVHQYRLMAVSATWRGQTAGHAGGREGGEGREGRGGAGRGGEGEGTAGQGRAGQGRGTEGGGQGRAGQGRGGGGEGTVHTFHKPEPL